MFGLGFTELIAILFIALIFVGPKKLPELAKSLGKGIRDFQDAAKGLGEKINEESNDVDDTKAAITDNHQTSEKDHDLQEDDLLENKKDLLADSVNSVDSVDSAASNVSNKT